MPHSSDHRDQAELELERELLQMFELDSQTDLQTYLTCVEHLEDESWTADIQKMYRAVHTIKGGSVTVKADAILDVATVLEDLLSELRYLETIPSLSDGQMQQILLEGGEIIASVLNNPEDNVQFKVERIQVLQKQIQANYLQDWNEQTQIQIEFAEQGFDLVVLDLEIALDNLPRHEQVPPATIKLAEQLLGELTEIGQELKLEPGWKTLLQEASQILSESDADLWKSQWHNYFACLKASVKQGGKLVHLKSTESTEDVIQSENLGEIDSLLDGIKFSEDSDANAGMESTIEDDWDLGEIDSLLDNVVVSENEISEDEESSAEDDWGLGEIDSLLDNVVVSENEISEDEESSAEDDWDLKEIGSLLDNVVVSENEISEDEESSAEDDWDLKEIGSLLDNVVVSENSQSRVAESTESKNKTLASSSAVKTKDKPSEDVQIPIPLSRLDKSAHFIVDTLIAARTMESFYQDLYQDLIKLVNLAKDNVQYITQLRQIQDDYALLENLNQQAPQNEQSPSLERYRQGYSTINRLLENSLRLSELGTEAEQTAKKTTEKVQRLNRHIIDLKDIVEDSRLVPFKNLAFRVRAILRDLIYRYDKPIQLTVRGEEIELDVGTSRRLEPILLHLVRNAFDHGLESPEARIIQGKSEQGTLNLSLQRYGSSYILSLEDDGQGIDPHQIQAKAQQLKFPLYYTDTPEKLLSVICQPGFSSQGKVSEVSGRGVGMDVVAEQISVLNGSLNLKTALGAGTTFTINFPVPHLLIPCLLLQAGDRSFAIPTDRRVR